MTRAGSDPGSTSHGKSLIAGFLSDQFENALGVLFFHPRDDPDEAGASLALDEFALSFR
jgi:hypothetical protein